MKRKASRQIDEYINTAPMFARPICEKIRNVIQRADAEIEEVWRWGPNFNKKGMLCAFGAFPTHVSLVFFKGALMKDPMNILIYAGANRHNRVVKFTSPEEVDEDTLLAYLKEAVMINELRIRTPPSSKVAEIPADLDAALSSNMIARENFLRLSYSNRKEYVDWVESARRQNTRDHRVMEVVKRSFLNQKLKEKYPRS